MRFVCFDADAAEDMVAGRHLQSVDFEDGRNLIDRLSGKTQLFKGIGRTIVTLDNNGMYFATPGNWKSKNYLIIDCETSKLFSNLKPPEALTSLQKILRFCLKFWSGSGAFNASEHMVHGTSKSILFPLPFSTGTGFRVAIEREPMADRLEKRDMAGKLLLVYKSGYEGADSSVEEVDLKNFRRAYDALPEIYRDIDGKVDVLAVSEQLGKRSSILEDFTLQATFQLSQSGGPNSVRDLSSQQLDFIKMPADKAVRLAGGAGTGKTTTLILRTLRILLDAERRGDSKMRALFITHSVATRRAIEQILDKVDSTGFRNRNQRKDNVSLTISTLADVCAEKLSQIINETEFVDRDAYDSKILQALYIEQAINKARAVDFNSHKTFLSTRFRSFFEETNDRDLTPVMQHEISVQIKGRSGDSFDAYKECKPLKYGLPIENDADKGFSFTIFRYYQDQLEKTYQFDSDDVVLTAIGQLDTPIWRRRRSQEGFDFIAIDESHLFNINELHIFHHLTRIPATFPISFTCDQAQAIGERGWDISSLISSTNEMKSDDINFTTVFRSSGQITEMCASILASGATLFTNFNNSLQKSYSNFTVDEERRAQPIHYISCADDSTMIEKAFIRANFLCNQTKSKPWETLIVCLSEKIFDELKMFAKFKNKPITILDRRSDTESIKSAAKNGHMILGLADYVGGLEFNAVVVVGIDKGRVPDEGAGVIHADARNYLKYISHNRLYVACSRARYALEILGVKARGHSEIISSAFAKHLIKYSE